MKIEPVVSESVNSVLRVRARFLVYKPPGVVGYDRLRSVTLESRFGISAEEALDATHAWRSANSHLTVVGNYTVEF